MSTFIVGVDLGQAVDYSALAVVEVTAAHPLQLQCRHLERYKLGTTYPDVVSKIAALMATKELSPAWLVVDATGVGRPVIDLLYQAGLRPQSVLVTAGDVTSYDGAYFRTPKRDLVGAVQAPLQDGRLKFAAGMPLVDTLVREMLAFKVKINAYAHDQYGSWREGEHDDLCFALMLACWWAHLLESQPEQQIVVYDAGVVISPY